MLMIKRDNPYNYTKFILKMDKIYLNCYTIYNKNSPCKLQKIKTQ